ncbi:hypothetical protein LguiA_010570 [Lonicera macranthoides]
MAMADALLLVVTLIATITLYVGFTLPNGYDDGNCGPLTLGSILISKADAQAFNITNYVAIISPIYAIFLYSIAKVLNTWIHQLIMIIVGAMLLAFTIAVHAVAPHPLSLIISLSYGLFWYYYPFPYKGKGKTCSNLET